MRCLVSPFKISTIRFGERSRVGIGIDRRAVREAQSIPIKSDVPPSHRLEHQSVTSQSLDDAELPPPGVSSKLLAPASPEDRPRRSPRTVDSGQHWDTWRY